MDDVLELADGCVSKIIDRMFVLTLLKAEEVGIPMGLEVSRIRGAVLRRIMNQADDLQFSGRVEKLYDEVMLEDKERAYQKVD